MATKKAAAGVEEKEPEKAAEDVVEQVLALEDSLKAAADALPSGDNSDAEKAAIRNAAHGIAHIRKARDQRARLAER